MASATVIKERELTSRSYKEIEPLDQKDAQLVSAAQRCLEAALDHSRASKIKLKLNGQADGEGPTIELPPVALRVVARLLGLMGERKPLLLIPKKHELTTQEVANMLNVSRPFIVKEIENNRLECHMVGTHRRIAYGEVVRYRNQLKAEQEKALQDLSDQAQELGI